MSRHPSWIFGKSVARRPPSVPSVTQPEPPAPREISTPDPADPGPGPALHAVELALAAKVAQLTEEKSALEDRLARAVSRMATLRRDVMQSSETELVKLAVAIAERVVGRELAADPALVVAWAKEAIQALGAGDEVVIAIASDVAEATPAEAWRGLAEGLQVKTDAALPDGAVEVRSPLGRVAAGATARLGAVGRAMGVGEP
jgi:flagellar biosynthesis/type III secretory pathway protein FliH